VDIRVANSPLVESLCPVNRHSVKLTYATAASAITDFGSVFVGGKVAKTLNIQNVGNEPLNVSLTGSLPEFTASPASVTIASGDSAPVNMIFSPTSAVTYSGQMHIASDAPYSPLILLQLTGVGLPPPVAGIDAGEFEIAVPPGGAAARTVRLSNTGQAELTWSTQSAALGASGAAPLLPAGSGRVGGSDAFGYVFRDSGAPGGPAFAWEEIRTAGIGLPVTGDDEGSGPIPIGFDFPFYGTTFSEVRVTSNGYISFTDDGAAYRPSRMLPDAGPAGVGNLVAPFWDDLDPGGVEKISYLADGQRFIVQYTGLDRLQGGSDLTFQAILFPDGRIRFQYLSMSGVLDAATIGIQDAGGSAGLLVSAGKAYARDGLAVEMVPPPAAWLTALPSSGNVPPGGYTDIVLTADSTGLPDGDHPAIMSILSNDPVNSPLDVSVLLHSGYTPLDLVDVEPNTLNLGSQGKTVRAKLQLPAAYDPHDILMPTVSLNGAIYPRTSPIDFADENGDGIDEMILKFNRSDLDAILPEGASVPVTLTGQVGNKTWFSGTDHIRAIRPQITAPNGGEYYLAGDPVTIAWEPPDWASTVSYDVILSRDGGTTWETMASGLTTLSYAWTAGGPPSSRVLFRVFASDSQGVLGYDTSDGFVTIADALYPPGEISGLTARVVGGDLELAWPAPPADLSHGPAASYRIFAAPSPAGPFVEIGTAASPRFLRALSAEVGGMATYKVIAVNASGQSP